MTKWTRQDWMDRAAAANRAADQHAAVAAQHEAEARRDPWSKSATVAMAQRDHEARCRSAAKHAREMACDVR